MNIALEIIWVGKTKKQKTNKIFNYITKALKSWKIKKLFSCSSSKLIDTGVHCYFRWMVFLSLFFFFGEKTWFLLESFGRIWLDFWDDNKMIQFEKLPKFCNVLLVQVDLLHYQFIICFFFFFFQIYVLVSTI